MYNYIAILIVVATQKKCTQSNSKILYLCAYVYAFITRRVKQIVGFEAKDMIGQEVMNFFHPKEMHDPKGIEHTQCHTACT